MITTNIRPTIIIGRGRRIRKTITEERRFRDRIPSTSCSSSCSSFVVLCNLLLTKTLLLCSLLLIITSVMIPTVSAFPVLLIDSSKAKCVSIEAPQDTVVRVQYEAYDYKKPEALEKIDTSNKKHPKEVVYLTINVVPSRRVLDTILHNSPVKSRLKPTMVTIQQSTGIVIHRMELDGTANICYKSSTASKHNPERFGFRIETSENDPRILLPSDKENNGDGGDKPTTKAAANLDDHLTHMERELQRINLAMDHVLREADFNKDQDTLFHKQTVAMHNATTFWPIVQVCILLITGFTQANHIVRFFKSRRII